MTIKPDEEEKIYRVYSNYLRGKYGEKVYKLPIILNITCPNRDGSKAFGGCIYCTEEGGSFENLSKELSVTEQLNINKDHIMKNHGAYKFIAYFQSFSNTYMPLEDFKKYISSALSDDILGINISTRPDLIYEDYMEFLSDFQTKNSVDITVELGLQSSNDKTLDILNRAHCVKDYIEAAKMIKKYDLRFATHVILDLPWDSKEDVLNTAEALNYAGSDEVKIHSLYIMDGSRLGYMYKNGLVKPLSKQEYIERVSLLLLNLNPNMVIQRLVGRSDAKGTLHCNWNESWWKIKDSIISYMLEHDYYQGKYYKKGCLTWLN